MKYSELELATAIRDLIQLALDKDLDSEIEKLSAQHPAIDEIGEFGPTGPVGSGLGIFGGHAIGNN